MENKELTGEYFFEEESKSQIEQTDSVQEEPQLTLSEKSISFLNETQKWTKFLSILGFVFVGFIFLAAIAMSVLGDLFSTFTGGNTGGGLMGIMGTILYILVGLLYFFPIYYLFKFSTGIKKSIENLKSIDLESSFENLKSHYKFIGIFTAIILGFYVIFGGAALVFGAFLG